MVLGEDKGMEIANENNIPVFMVVKTMMVLKSWLRKHTSRS
ncbi:thiamin biosynthesis lipoprotein ApbE [Vibrio sp. JCM 19052]|nr:thiamin biosynthesis lipoprotein ApbE [Vibrio sp. JCM 19052]